MSEDKNKGAKSSAAHRKGGPPAPKGGTSFLRLLATATLLPVEALRVRDTTFQRQSQNLQRQLAEQKARAQKRPTKSSGFFPKAMCVSQKRRRRFAPCRRAEITSRPTDQILAFQRKSYVASLRGPTRPRFSNSNDLHAIFTLTEGWYMNTSGAILRSPPQTKCSKSTWIQILQDADKPDAARVVVQSCTMATA